MRCAICITEFEVRRPLSGQYLNSYAKGRRIPVFRAVGLDSHNVTDKACSACYENTYFILLLLPKIVCQLALSSVLLFDLAIASSWSTIA